MSTLSIANPTLLDFTRELGPDGKVSNDIAEILNLRNDILNDMVVTEGNLTTGHRFLMRTGIPAPTWLKVNGFIQPTKATSIPVQQNCGHLSALCQIDPKMAGASNLAAFRRNQEVAHIEGMSQEMASTLFNGNEATEPEAFTGFAPYYNLSTGNENSANVIKSDDAATTNSDIWIVGWGTNKIHGFFPNGSQAGLQYRDLGEQLVGGTTAGTQGVRLSSTFDWELGLAIEDWRYCGRAHFGYTLADTYLSAGTGTSMIDMMIKLEEMLPSTSDCRPVFYMSKKALTYLRLQINKKAANNLTQDTVAGKRQVQFDGIPIVRTDAILDNYSALSA